MFRGDGSRAQKLKKIHGIVSTVLSGIVAENTHDKYRKNSKCNKIPDLEKKGSQEGPRNIASIKDFFFAS